MSDESEFLLQGRFWGQAPEVDGKVFLANGEAQPGELRKVLVTSAADYDLVGDLLSPDGTSLVFIVEKDEVSDSGINIRYMVETVNIG